MEADFDSGGVLLDEEYESGFAYNVARICDARGFHAAHDPGSRGDFIQALQLLGARPGVRRLLHEHSPLLNVRVHVSCSRAIWTEVFGEPECVEEAGGPLESALYLWKHFCTDGPITCIGHLFERRPCEAWVVVVRVSLN